VQEFRRVAAPQRHLRGHVTAPRGGYLLFTLLRVTQDRALSIVVEQRGLPYH